MRLLLMLLCALLAASVSLIAQTVVTTVADDATSAKDESAECSIQRVASEFADTGLIAKHKLAPSELSSPHEAFLQNFACPPSPDDDLLRQRIVANAANSIASELPAFGRTRAMPILFPVKLPEQAAPGSSNVAKAANGKKKEGFHWKAALNQSLLLLAIQHGYAMTQPKTRRELSGPFFKDYFESVGNLSGWADGGRFFTNYIAHPLQGATTGFIQIQNDPKGIKQQFGRSKSYWTSRLKAMGWSAAMSTQFELGPISQASIGNVGKARKLTYVDIVTTPTIGTALLISEDALDRYVVRWVESKSGGLYLRIVARLLLNPSRSCANLFRFKKPWHRDR